MQYNDIFNYKSIVFRGKNILNNNWIYGYFKQDNNKMYIEIIIKNFKMCKLKFYFQTIRIVKVIISKHAI